MEAALTNGLTGQERRMAHEDATEAARAVSVFDEWIQAWAAAVAEGGSARDDALFRPDAYWRDLLSFSGAFRTWRGNELAQTLAAAQGYKPSDVRCATDRPAPVARRRSGQSVVEGFFDFSTAVGDGTGYVRLLDEDGTGGGRGPGGYRASLLLTTLQTLRGFPERIGPLRPTGLEYALKEAGTIWSDFRASKRSFEDRDPEVLIVGAGQAGLSLAARLGQFQTDVLVVEKNSRVGDNWRQRYRSLTLHNEICANHLPYLPFPATWPAFLPKDKVAAWLEFYTEAMDLNVWTSTELVHAWYDRELRRWTAKLTVDGTNRTLCPKHLVLACGAVSGVPYMPVLPGLDGFRGEVLHSSSFASGAPFHGQDVLVVGTGNSGHDIAQELTVEDARVTMLQRSPTCVVSLIPASSLVYRIYNEGATEDIDLITAAVPYEMLVESHRYLARKMAAFDEDLLRGLHEAGFETDYGPDGSGYHLKYLRAGGGYYINVGCSELIAQGRVHLVQQRDVDTFAPHGLTLRSGTELAFDAIILATGYQNQRMNIGRLLGKSVADEVGEVWGFDDEGFMRNMWTRTRQENLWIMGGSLMESRLFSRFLALQIKADLEGVSLGSAGASRT
jgi:cation diffusion facilitator CzcD-associated flavoprotein CzcO